VCGIVGYVGDRPCRDLLLYGLQMLEYRGYDSAGLSLLVDGQIDSVRAVGHLTELNEAVQQRTNGGGPDEFESTTGIAHTRWATHGAVTEDNAHPHFDTKDRVHIVLNGIVENHTQLRKDLLDAGAEFTSETAEKGGYDTFMLKEIHEQPDAVAETISDRTPGDHVELAELSDELLADV